MKAFISAIEYALPARILTNHDLDSEKPHWDIGKIEETIGIRQRHIAAEDECASDLGVTAVQKLLDRSSCQPDSVDFLLYCTQSPDHFLPSTACIVQDQLGLSRNVGALDINLGCSGYIYGLGLAKGLIETGQARNVILVTADTYSKYIHPDDRSVRTIFGDAATATLIQSAESEKEIIGPFEYGTDGSGAKNLIVPAGAARQPRTHETGKVYHDSEGNLRCDDFAFMDGSRILTFSLRTVPGMVGNLYKKTGLSIEDIDLFVLHQTNRFMLDALRTKLKIPESKFVHHYEDLGNTGSSSIPITLNHLNASSRLKGGMRVMLVGFGVGYSWGATVVEWQ